MFNFLQCFMHNEVSTSPILTISLSSNVSHNIKGLKHQKETLSSLTKLDQDTLKGKKALSVLQTIVINKNAKAITG